MEASFVYVILARAVTNEETVHRVTVYSFSIFRGMKESIKGNFEVNQRLIL